MSEIDYHNLGYKIIQASFEVRKQLGRFLYEDSYERAMQVELNLMGIKSERQKCFDVYYKGVKLDKSYKIDLLVEDQIQVELKALSYMANTEVSQILSYMRFGGYKVGYLMNLGATDFTTGKFVQDQYLDKGIYRFVL